MELIKLQQNGTTEIMGMQVPIIEGGFGEGKRCLTIPQIKDIHGMEVGHINDLIRNNYDEFEERIDIIDLMDNEISLNVANDLGLITNNRQNNCFILSEQGYMTLVNLMRTPKAKEIRKELRRSYFAMREVIKVQQAVDTKQLSPELQMFKQIFDTVATQQIQQKQIEEEQKRLGGQVAEVLDEIDGIKDVVSLNTDNWRDDTTKLINKMAKIKGGNTYIQDFRAESYDILQKRLGVNLKTRLDNRKKKMLEYGVAKSKIDKVNNLDVIGEDKKLITGYVSIIKEMAIKYGATKNTIGLI